LDTGSEESACHPRSPRLFMAARRTPSTTDAVLCRSSMAFELFNEISILSRQLYLPVYLAVSIQP
jgi:hypothetical protein